jgi:hypothetical protein
MPMYVVPSREHPIYVEWRKWRHRNDAKWTPDGQAAIESIQKIAEHAYPDHPAIVGYMIMMDDTQTEEEQERPDDQG